MRIFKNRWFSKFARKERISNEMLCKAVQQAEIGLIEADLGGGLIKQRIARQGQGKSGGYRTLVIYRAGKRAVFAFGFAKNAIGNIGPDDLVVLKDAAAIVLNFSDADMTRLLANDELEEVICDDSDQ